MRGKVQQVAEKPASTVTPAEAGVQNAAKRLDSRFRGNDDPALLEFYATLRLPLRFYNFLKNEKTGSAPFIVDREKVGFKAPFLFYGRPK
jgi:hypothetical protein